MKTAIIQSDFNIYGGDFDRVLYLQEAIEGRSLQLCITGMSCSLGIHLTSDDEYKAWLFKHIDYLTMFPAEVWYVSKFHTGEDVYHNEFMYTINKLGKMIMDIDKLA